MNRQGWGDGGVPLLQQWLALRGPAPSPPPHSLARRPVAGREHAGRARPGVRGAAPCRRPGEPRQEGWPPIRAGIGGFSSTPRPPIRSGGSRYCPTTSRTVSPKPGSSDRWKDAVRWGGSPKARPRRLTAVGDRAGHRARGPRGGPRRRRLQGLREDGLARRIGEAAGGARSGRSLQAAEAVGDQPRAPLADPGTAAPLSAATA
jgi:hypothetical protein